MFWLTQHLAPLADPRVNLLAGRTAVRRFMCILLSLLPFSMSVLVDLSVPWYGLLLVGGILCCISFGYMLCLWLFIKKTPPRPAHFAELTPTVRRTCNAVCRTLVCHSRSTHVHALTAAILRGQAGQAAHGARAGEPPVVSPRAQAGGGGGHEKRAESVTPVRDSHVRALLKVRLSLQAMCGVAALIGAACQVQSHWWPGVWCTVLAVVVLTSAPLYRNVYFLPRWCGALPGQLETLDEEEGEGDGDA